MWPRSFRNNPCRKLLLLLVVISKQGAGVSCSVSPSAQQEAQGKSKASAKLSPSSPLQVCSCMWGTRQHQGDCHPLHHWHFAVARGRRERGLLGWGWRRSLVGPRPLLLHLGEGGDGKGRWQRPRGVIRAQAPV